MSRNTSKRGKPGGWSPDGPARSGAGHAPRREGAREDETGPVWIWGTHAVAAVLANPAREVLSIVATENALPRIGLGKHQPQLVTARELDHRLPAGAVHQGIAVRTERLDTMLLEEVIAEGATRIAILDSVSDPHNLGAIFRSAAAFGFTALVLQTRGAPPITGVVAKSAAGAIEVVTEVRAVNLARSLDLLGEAGFHTVGLAGEATRDLSAAVKGAGKLAIVLGAEGEGLRPAVAKACAELARIPMTGAMESLNVSNAAAIAFYEASRN